MQRSRKHGAYATLLLTSALPLKQRSPQATVPVP